MKVAELVAVLQTLPQDEEILIQGQYDDLDGYCTHGNSVSVQYEKFVISTITKKDGRSFETVDHVLSNYAGCGKNSREVIKLVLSDYCGEPYINLDKSEIKCYKDIDEK